MNVDIKINFAPMMKYDEVESTVEQERWRERRERDTTSYLVTNFTLNPRNRCAPCGEFCYRPFFHISAKSSAGRGGAWRRRLSAISDLSHKLALLSCILTQHPLLAGAGIGGGRKKSCVQKKIRGGRTKTKSLTNELPVGQPDMTGRSCSGDGLVKLFSFWPPSFCLFSSCLLSIPTTFPE